MGVRGPAAEEQPFNVEAWCLSRARGQETRRMCPEPREKRNVCVVKASFKRTNKETFPVDKTEPLCFVRTSPSQPLYSPERPIKLLRNVAPIHWANPDSRHPAFCSGHRRSVVVPGRNATEYLWAPTALHRVERLRSCRSDPPLVDDHGLAAPRLHDRNTRTDDLA